MEKLVNFINTLGSTAHTGPKLDSKDIIICQKELCRHGIAPVPGPYLEFLHHFNALTCDSAALFGIAPQGDFYLDILRENILIDHPEKSAIIILGYDEMNYLGCNSQKSLYLIIDKSDLEVLHTYNNCDDALMYFLKIYDV